MDADRGSRPWTNASALAFAGDADPLDQAHEVAGRLLELAAREGLAGPPVDVFALAEKLGITLRPKNDLQDARVVASRGTPGPELTIEYNPSRPRGRLRFSIAHEIAHAQFADVAERPRHRTAAGSVEQTTSDDWELELLCDVIAADLLIPSQAVEGLLTVDPDIDFIMETRRRWDVSTEALLRRLVNASPRPLLLLALSRIEQSESRSLRVDYVEQSSTSSPNQFSALAHGDRISGVDLLLRCTAIGQTVSGFVGSGAHESFVQAVGAPAYPGRSDPRILTLVEPRSARLNEPNLHFMTSDLLAPAKPGTPLIYAHVVSDAAHRWGFRGVAGALSRAYPDFAQAFRAWTIASSDNLSLGRVHYVERVIDSRIVGVASLVAQEGYGSKTPMLRYDALEQSLDALARLAITRGADVHLPRLGAGQAGGRWDFIEGTIVQHLVKRGLDVTIHTRPDTAVREG